MPFLLSCSGGLHEIFREFSDTAAAETPMGGTVGATYETNRASNRAKDISQAVL